MRLGGTSRKPVVTRASYPPARVPWDKRLAAKRAVPQGFAVVSPPRRPYSGRVRIVTTRVTWLVVLASFFGHFARIGAAEPTAFALAKEGDRYLGEQSKDKVVEIFSEKSVASLTPNIWSVVYYDPTATLKAIEVKFGAGKMLQVKRPLRVWQRMKGKQEPIDFSKLKVDSDRAIEFALKDPLLEKLTIQATQLKLMRGEGGQPIWKVRLWAVKLRHPSDQADLGEVTISAEDGSIVKSDLNIHRVD